MKLPEEIIEKVYPIYQEVYHILMENNFTQGELIVLMLCLMENMSNGSIKDLLLAVEKRMETKDVDDVRNIIGDDDEV